MERLNWKGLVVRMAETGYTSVSPICFESMKREPLALQLRGNTKKLRK